MAIPNYKVFIYSFVKDKIFVEEKGKEKNIVNFL